MPRHLESASMTLSVVIFSTITNTAAVPGLEHVAHLSLEPPVESILSTRPRSAPIPAPTARPSTGTNNKTPKGKPQNIHQVAPIVTGLWVVRTWNLPLSSWLITAVASGSTSESAAKRSSSASASSAASGIDRNRVGPYKAPFSVPGLNDSKSESLHDAPHGLDPAST